MSEFCLPIRVYIEDTDAGGVVFYVNYLKFMERARTELLRSLGYDKPAVFEHDLLFVVKTVEVSYDKPAVLDDQLLATARLLKVGRASFVLEQKIKRQNVNDGSEEILCQGVVKIGCISQQGMAPTAMPDAMFKHLRSLV